MTSKGSFHGTGISLFQFPGQNTNCTSQEPVAINLNRSSRDVTLPERYSIVSAVSLVRSQAYPPQPRHVKSAIPEIFCPAVSDEKDVG